MVIEEAEEEEEEIMSDEPPIIGPKVAAWFVKIDPQQMKDLEEEQNRLIEEKKALLADSKIEIVPVKVNIERFSADGKLEIGFN